jgi:hypothetical protein
MYRLGPASLEVGNWDAITSLQGCNWANRMFKAADVVLSAAKLADGARSWNHIAIQ